MPEIYSPAEDSFFLASFVEKEINKINNKKSKDKLKILDMGSGSGIQAQTCILSGIKPENLTLIDINSTAISYLKKHFPLSTIIQSDLFTNVGDETWDLIIFNPPYLPENKYDKKPDTTGGKKGDETIVRFLKQAKKHLNKNGKILLLTSSLTPNINFNRLGYKSRLLGEKKLFFEEIYVWGIMNSL
ncbi:MAG: methyltransferase [Nanoarchaeota archaeon]|nr:methyltransferase [Nanoarchaeota archaeon]